MFDFLDPTKFTQNFILLLIIPLLVLFFMIIRLDNKIYDHFDGIFNKKKRKKPSRLALFFSYSLKGFWRSYDQFFYPIHKTFSNFFKVPFFLQLINFESTSNISRKLNDGYHEMLSDLNKSLTKAQKIQFCLGEMGKELMENPLILDGILKAYNTNHAKIQIVGGPRIDPKTKTIFELEKEGIVEIFRSKQYEPNHFVLITFKNQKIIVLNECIHNETIWKSTKGDSYLDSYTRSLFLIENKKKYIDFFKKECEKRISQANKIKEHPGINPPQDISSLKLISNSIIIGYIKKHILQPISIYLDIPLACLFNPK